MAVSLFMMINVQKIGQWDMFILILNMIINKISALDNLLYFIWNILLMSNTYFLNFIFNVLSVL